MATAVQPEAPVVHEKNAPQPKVDAEHGQNANWQSVIEKISRSNGGEANPSPAERQIATDAQQLTNENIAGTPAESEPAPTPEGEAPAPEADVPAATTATELLEETPEGEIKLRARDPETGQFAEMDTKRTYELSMKDKATGETKVYEKDLAGLMRLAKDGIGLQRMQSEIQRSANELTYYREHAGKWEAQTKQLQDTASQYEALAKRLLLAPDHEVVAMREQYQQEMTPDKIAARQLQSLDAERQRLASEREHFALQQQLDAFRSRVSSAISEAQQLAGEANAGWKLMQETAPFMVNGRIPPDRFDAVAQYITGPYLEWAKQQAKPAATTTETVRKLQQTNQKLVNQVGGAVRPVGRSGADVAPKTAPRNVNDAIDRILKRPVPGAGPA